MIEERLICAHTPSTRIQSPIQKPQTRGEERNMLGHM